MDVNCKFGEDHASEMSELRKHANSTDARDMAVVVNILFWQVEMNFTSIGGMFDGL